MLASNPARSAPLMRGLKHKLCRGTIQRLVPARAVCPAYEGIETELGKTHELLDEIPSPRGLPRL